MNPYTKNVSRAEFLITMACTGRCKHCSEGDHPANGPHLSAVAASRALRSLGAWRKLESVMVFGGEPLLFPATVCAIHAAAKDMNIPVRQLITNGFFSQDDARIEGVAQALIESGANDILLSADAFHQEHIPLEPVKTFAQAVVNQGGRIRIHPAWLVSPSHKNPYNLRTKEILAEFEAMGLPVSAGNIIFPSGNAARNLAEYFDSADVPADPYAQDPFDLHAVSISPDGSVLGGNISDGDLHKLLEEYEPD